MKPDLLTQIKRAGYGVITLKTNAHKHVPPTLHSRTATALRRRGLITVTTGYPRLVFLTELGSDYLNKSGDF